MTGLVVDKFLKGENKRGRELHSVNFVELLINVIDIQVLS